LLKILLSYLSKLEVETFGIIGSLLATTFIAFWDSHNTKGRIIERCIRTCYWAV